jgi:hypothetical protein
MEFFVVKEGGTALKLQEDAAQSKMSPVSLLLVRLWL